MWGRLSGVANNVAGLVAPVYDEQVDNELVETKDMLETTQQKLKTALKIIEDRDRDVLNSSKANASSAEVLICFTYLLNQLLKILTKLNILYIIAPVKRNYDIIKLYRLARTF